MKFALVEDQVMFRSLLRRLLVEECNGKVVLESGSLSHLRAHVEALSKVDLLLLDIRLPDGDGIDFVEEMNKQQISVPVLLFSSSCEDYIVHRVSRSFVQGFVHKDEEPNILLTAIQMVAAGGAFFSPRFVERQRALANTPQLRKRNFPARAGIFAVHRLGYSDAEAAAALGMTASTAQTHRRNVMAKLDLHSAKELQAYALKAGFTTVERLH